MTWRLFGALGIANMVAALAGCAVPDKPSRAVLYDLGSNASMAQPTAPQLSRAPLVLADVQAAGTLDGAALLYRLGYADDHQLRPYAQARWSVPPPQLVRQRLRQQLGRQRVVLDLNESPGLLRSGSSSQVLRIELEEFCQLFESQTQSWGLLALRATLLDRAASGEQRLAQRSFVIRKPAPTPDAAGGVQALAVATDAAAEEISQWLAQPR